MPKAVRWPRLATAALAVSLAACAMDPPPCPPLEDPPEHAPSAGCLTVIHGRMLAVQGWGGRVSPPGGHAEPGEDARCAAHRETWEETGLNLTPRRLLRTFDTGFKLYQCSVLPDAGEIDPRHLLEVRRAYWLPVEDFGRVDWRFPEQGTQLRQLIQTSEPASPSR